MTMINIWNTEYLTQGLAQINTFRICTIKAHQFRDFPFLLKKKRHNFRKKKKKTRLICMHSRVLITIKTCYIVISYRPKQYRVEI